MSELTLLNLEQPTMRADFESTAPTGISMQDVASMEQFLIGVKTQTGQFVTPQRAMRCATVLAIMRGLSEDLSSLTCKLYKRTNQNGVPVDVEATDHVVSDLIDTAPNDIMTSVEVREHIMFDMMLYGNFYVLKNMNPRSGDIDSLWPLQAAYVTRRWRETVWTFTDPLTGTSGAFTPDLCWRGTILSGNGIDGQAITLLAREAIGLLLAAEEQGARLFRQGVQTDLTLSTDNEIDTEGKNQLREAFMQRHSGSSNAFMPLLLENGLKAARIGLTAQESQYLEARNFQVQDIARAFRYPEVLLGSSGKGSKSATYASAEQFFQSYTKHTLTPWAVRIEQTMGRDLLSPGERARGYFVKHDFSSLLRADTAGRFASYAVAIDKGFMTPGYAARQEQLPWKPELEYYNKPAAPPDGANQQDEKSTPTDQSGKNELPRRMASYILKKEHKSLVGEKREADAFYAHFGGFVEDMTGADVDRVLTYLEMRRTTADRFSDESQEKAIASLIQLCQKDA